MAFLLYSTPKIDPKWVLYSNNRFIASCRIAAYRSFQNFSRFTDVAIANFDEQQIRCFIENWFKSHDRSEWGAECQVRLNSDDHKATRELAQTPLLLTLICILFLKRGEFPTKRATLYEEAVWTLLAEWDASKDIVRQQPYKGLDTKCKEIMLAEIAYSNFTSNNLFLQQGEITQQIETILLEILTDEQRIDGREVLRAVEEQHGLLVNRYDDIYSFSHLTIQEFLTAKHIIDNQLDISEIVQKHLFNKRWREVFLLLAGLRKADSLLLEIECQIQTCAATPKLQKLLEWVKKVSNPSSGKIQAIGKRSLVIANSYANANASYYANAGLINLNPEYNGIAIMNATDIASNYTDSISFPNAIALTHANVIALIHGNVVSNKKGYTVQYAYTYAINQLINYMKWAVKFEIYQELDSQGIIRKLEYLQSQLPEDELQIQSDFGQNLIKIILADFHLTHEMVDLPEDEIQILDNYLYAIKLLIECNYAAVRRTPEVWSQIEERLLRPAVTTN